MSAEPQAHAEGIHEEQQWPLRVLLVQGRPGDADLTSTALTQVGFSPAIRIVHSEPAYLVELQASPDIILCDHALQHFNSNRALRLLQASGLDIPFIIVSGHAGEDNAVEALRLGVDDYIFNDQLSRLGAAVASALERARLRRQARTDAGVARRTQERLDLFLQHSPSVMFIKDKEGRYLHVNQEFLRVTGLLAEEVIDKRDEDIFPQRQAAQNVTNDSAVRTLGHTVHFEETAFCGPSTRTFAVVKFPMAENSGGECNIGGIATDITERKEMEERFRATFEQAAVGIAHTSLGDSRFVMVNDALCDMLGYSPAELVGKRTVDVLHPSEEGIGQRSRRLLQNKEKTYSSERRYVHKAGRTIWIKGTVSLVHDAAGEPAYMLRVLEDITARKLAQQRATLLQESTVAISSAEDVATALRIVLQTICRSTGWDYGQAWMPDASGTSLEVRAAWDDGSLTADAFRRTQGTLRPGAGGGIAHSVFEGQRHRSIGDLAQVEFNRRDSALSAGFHSWVGIPVVVRGKTMALLEFFMGRSKSPDADLVETVAVVAKQLGNLFQHKAARESLRDSEERFRQLADNIPQVFWTTNADQSAITYVSAAFETLTGLPASAGDRWFERVHADDRERVAGEWSRVREGGMFDVEFRMLHVNGAEHCVRARAFRVYDSEGAVVTVAGITEDITEQKLAQQRLLHLAHYDHLTGLPNRTLFYDRLKQVLGHSRRKDGHAAVLLVDLDRFKTVNDSLGHACGDDLLQQVGKRLSDRLRSGDTVGRVGGDQFGLVLTDLPASEDAGHVAQDILAALAEPFELAGNNTCITASVGIAIYPSDSVDLGALVRYAETANASAKAAGRNVYRYYTAEMNERALERMELERQLHGALEREEFLLHFQPKVDLVTGDIAGFEALLRWQPENGPLVAPMRFIPLLEETGLIVPVGEWVLRAACAQIRAWKDARLRITPIAINLSSRQLHQQDFCAVVARTLHEYHVPAHCLELEITESAAMENAEVSIAMLHALKKLGVHLSIDDFGTGYSSLSYLKRLPVGTVKIDRSFITDIATSPDDASLAQAIISMAHKLNLKVVAEGVETASQLSFLTAHGCDQMQGYYFSKPLGVEDATEMLHRNLQLQRPPANADNGERTLLLLDDEENILASLKRLLRRDNYEIHTATNATAAFEILANHKVGVIVTDQLMPGMTGVEFLRRVKELYPGSVRMVLSGYTDLDSVTDAINQGAIYRFLTKPWEDSLLRAHVAEGFRRFVALREGERVHCEASARLDELTRANHRLQTLLDVANPHACTDCASTPGNSIASRAA